jgi:hypothetical protein
VTAVRTAGAGTNLITLNQSEEAVEFVYYNSVWQFNHNRSFIEPIFFSGTNAPSNRAASRTNLGLGATWLTNTNVTNFRSAINVASATSYDGVADKSLALVDNDGNAVRLSYDESGGDEWIVSNPLSFRTAIGLPLPALTNTNNANFQAAVFATNAAPTNSANVNTVNFNTAVHWMEVTVKTNGTNATFRIPLFQ